jgi:hypothetical protein
MRSADQQTDSRVLHDRKTPEDHTMTEKLTLDEFNEHYRVVPTSLLGLPQDLSHASPVEPLQGDCQTYTRTVRKIVGAALCRALVWRCWSPQNWKKFPYVPRHAVLWVKGRGWIDSTEREWRDSPTPHTRCWPVGTPAILWLLYTFGVFRGWWPAGLWLL